MAVELVWSALALQDAEEIATRISKDSPRYAKSMVRRFFRAAETLRVFPRIGRVIPERKDERYRDLIVYSYRLIYKVKGERVEVLAILHGARLLEGAIGDRLPPPPRT